MNYVEGKLNEIPTVSELMDEVKKCEDGLDSKLGKNDLIAGENINIEKVKDKVIISAIGGSSEYIAGDGINIRNNIISFDNHKLDNYATKEEIPDISGLATKEELSAVEAQIPDVSQFITDEEVAEEYLSKTDASSTYATKNDIPDVSDFVTNENLDTTLQDYAKESEIPTDYVTKSTKIGNVEIQDGINDIKNLRYETLIKEVVNLSILDTPNWNTLYELNPDIEEILYETNDGNTMFQFNYSSIEEDIYTSVLEFTITLDNWDSFYIIFNKEFTNQDVYGDYTFHPNQWYYVIGYGDSAVIEESTTPEVEIDDNNIIEDKEDFFYCLVNKETQIETIDKTLQDTKEDLPNWVYNKETTSKYIYGIEDGKEYKVNFDVNNYLSDLSTFGDNNTFYDDSNTYLKGYQTSSATLRINFNNITYWFILDVTDTINYGAWRKGTNNGSNINYDAYTPEELANVTFTLDITKVPSDATLLNYFKNIILNEDGSEVNELIDGNTYKVNFNNNQAFIDLLEYYFDNITSGGLEIYNPNVDTNSIRIWNATGGTYGLQLKIFNSYSRTSNYYYFMQELGSNYPGRWYRQSYRANSYVYAREALEDVYFTISRDAIIDETLLRKIITNLDGSPIVEDHEETKTTITTLKEQFNNYKDWIYEQNGVGILDIPKWEQFEGIEYKIIYEEPSSKEISCQVNPFGTIMITIYDTTSNKGYIIFNEDYETKDSTYKANTWYCWDLSSFIRETVECNTPNITLEEEYVLDRQLLNAIYGEKTLSLGQKINNIDKAISNIEPLKDKIYDGVNATLEDGKSYNLSDDYTDFFNKYTGINSTIFYGTMPDVEPKSGSGEFGNTKNGVETVEITCINLYTDTPFIRDGEESGVLKEGSISLLGSTCIELYTTEGTLTYYKGDTSWTYDKQEIPLENIPPLVLDSSLIKNEEMLRDFLKLEDTLQTLEEKFNEVENTPLKDKIYTTVEATNLVNEQEYAFKENIDDFFTKGYEYQDIYDINNGSEVIPVQPLGKAPSIEIEPEQEYITFITYNWASDFDITVKYIELHTNTYIYYYNENENIWNVDGEPMTPPNLVYNSEYVLNEDMLKDILNLITPQTLEQKLDSIEAPYSIVDYQETSGTLNSITVKSKETGEETTLNVGGGGKQLYQHNITLKNTSGGTRFAIAIIIINDSATQFDAISTCKYIYDCGKTSESNFYNCSGRMTGGNSGIAVGCYCTSGTQPTANFFIMNINSFVQLTAETATDNVIAL